MKNINYIILCLCILIIGCKKNIDIINIEDPDIPVLINNYQPIKIDVISSVLGTVINESGEAVEGAIVTIDGLTETTNPFGTFKFSNVNMNKNGTFIKIKKSGYFESGRRIFPQNSETNRVRIELIKKEFSQVFKTDNGGEVNFENNGKVVFAPNSIMTENGEPYSGEVNVALEWLDPTATKTFNQMPGALQGVNLDGEEKVLETYGMIAVELEGVDGEPLNIAKNQTAEIRMPVPSSILQNAPDEIPLWSFNYEYGIWEEEGKALLQNGFYVGDVSHFSFWNCDDPYDLINFLMTLVEETTGERLEDMKTVIKLLNGSSSQSGYSNKRGELSGLIPANELLQVRIYDKCNDLYLEKEIGPFSENVNLGEVNISIPQETLIKGSLLDCNGEKLNEGFLMILVEDQNYYYEVEDSIFEILVPICNGVNSIAFAGGNLSTYEMGDFTTFPIDDTLNINDLLACGGSLVNFAKVTVGKEYSVYFPLKEQSQSLQYDTTFFIFDKHTFSSNIFDLKFSFHGTTTGDYSNTQNFLNQYVEDDLDVLVGLEHFENFEIMEYGLFAGERISGRMSGNFTNYFSTPVSNVFIEVEFVTIRDF